MRKIFEVAKPFFPLFSILCLLKHFPSRVKATATEVFSSFVLTVKAEPLHPLSFPCCQISHPSFLCMMMAQAISLRLLSHLPLELIQKGASAGREVQMGQISYVFLLFGTSCISTCPCPHPPLPHKQFWFLTSALGSVSTSSG